MEKKAQTQKECIEDLADLRQPLAEKAKARFAIPVLTSNADNRNQIVVFALDEPRYALLLSNVERVVRAVEITPLPNAPAIVQGAINVQGKVIPVVNIRERLRLPAREIKCGDHFIIVRTQRRNVALMADYVAGIRECADREMVSAEQALPFIEYLQGVAKIEDNLILIYDLDAFLSLEEEQMLDNAISGGTEL